MRKSIFSFVVLAILVVAGCQPKQVAAPVGDFSNQLTDAEKDGGRLTPEILWKFGRVGGGEVSPDGKTVLYSVTRYDAKTNKRTSNIFTIPVQGGDAVKLTTDAQSDFAPVWINGGVKIAFMSTTSGSVQVWKMNPDGTEKVQISKVDGGINSFRFAPNEAHVMYTKDVKLEKTATDVHTDLPLADARIINDLMYRHWNDWSDYHFSHIFDLK